VELAKNHDWFTGSLVEQFCCQEKYETCFLSKKIDEKKRQKLYYDINEEEEIKEVITQY